MSSSGGRLHRVAESAPPSPDTSDMQDERRKSKTFFQESASRDVVVALSRNGALACDLRKFFRVLSHARRHSFSNARCLFASAQMKKTAMIREMEESDEWSADLCRRRAPS